MMPRTAAIEAIAEDAVGGLAANALMALDKQAMSASNIKFPFTLFVIFYDVSCFCVGAKCRRKTGRNPYGGAT
jgi:hypothetical protein